MERKMQQIDFKEDKPMIGQEVYDLTEITSDDPRAFYENMQSAITPDLAALLQSRLHNNSAVASKKIFGDQRPASSYFTELDGKLLVEWGLIDPNGEAKLHKYLNREIDITERIKKGAIIRSGHIGEVNLPTLQSPVRVALFDSLANGSPVKNSAPEFNMTITLVNHNILPITSDGFPVEFEDYKSNERR